MLSILELFMCKKRKKIESYIEKKIHFLQVLLYFRALSPMLFYYLNSRNNKSEGINDAKGGRRDVLFKHRRYLFTDSFLYILAPLSWPAFLLSFYVLSNHFFFTCRRDFATINNLEIFFRLLFSTCSLEPLDQEAPHPAPPFPLCNRESCLDHFYYVKWDYVDRVISLPSYTSFLFI